MKIELTPDEAKIIDNELTDMLVWCMGFAAAMKHVAPQHTPLGMHGVRLIRDRVRVARKLEESK